MSTSVSSPEDVINLALARIGYPKRIGSIYDGNLPAKLSLAIYAQTRDAVLRSADWGFACKTTALVNSGQTPPPPWAYSYTYPTDALKIRDLIISAFDPLNPLPSRWVVQNDPTAGKVIVTAAPYVDVVYTVKSTNPAYWESAFVEALAAALGRRLAPVLNKELLQAAAQDEDMESKTAIAESE